MSTADRIVQRDVIFSYFLFPIIPKLIMFKNLKIGYKLAFMVIIPIMGLIYFTIDSTLEKLAIVNQMNLLEELSDLTVKSSSLIHELQKERGISAGFIGSEGVEFSEELQVQRIKTDRFITELDLFVKNFNFEPFSNEMKDTLEIIFTELNAIESRRNQISQLDISAEEQILYYTTIIESLLVGIHYLSKVITNAELSNMVVTYVNLLQAKEKAGVERATLNNAFSKGHFAPGMYRKFILLVGAQDDYIKNFFFFATKEQKRLYRETIRQGQFLEEVKKIRKIAFKKAFKSQFIANLYRYVGYGGLIHQLNNYILWGEQKYIETFYQQYQHASTVLELYKSLPYVSPTEIKNIELIENTFNTYTKYLTTVIALKEQQKSVEEIDAVIAIDDAPVVKALTELLTHSHLGVDSTYWWKMATGRINLLKAIEDQITYDLKVSVQILKKQAKSTFIFYLIIAGGTTLLTIFFSSILAHGITKPLKKLVQMANQIASGDRDIRMKVNSRDETGQLSSAMILMLHSIKRSELMLKETSEAYAHFVPNEFLQLLNKNHILDIQLGNHLEMKMTILFSDIRSFTTLSEKMLPQDNFNFLNDYLKEMGPIIREHNGFIDKYIGDAIMALFMNADDAVKASIVMLKMLDIFNQVHKIQTLAPIKIGIGLNTGKLMLGIIGEENRRQCTVISDAVNLASRLEGTTKTYKGTMIISQNTFDSLTNPSQYAIRFLDNIKVKGRSERTKIYEVFNGDPAEIRDGKLATLDIFETGVRLYQMQRFNKAQKLMQECLEKNPYDAAAKIYLQRCQKFLEITSSENWEKIAHKIEWSKDLLLNENLLDQHHKELFIKIKNLIMSIGSGKTEEEVCEMIHFLEDYVVTHFEVEEMYMEQYNYPYYAVHKAEHAQFIENYQQFKQDYKTKGGHLSLALQIQQDIIDWLTYHVGSSDKDLGIFLKGKA